MSRLWGALGKDTVTRQRLAGDVQMEWKNLLKLCPAKVQGPEPMVTQLGQCFLPAPVLEVAQAIDVLANCV